MNIIASAPVPVGNLVSSIPTIELPKIRTSQPEPAAAQPAPSLPCPAFCTEHKHYPQNEDRNVWGHTSRPTTVQATYADDAGPTETNTVEVQAERFDFGTRPATRWCCWP